MLQCEALPPSFAGLLTALRPCFTAPSFRTFSALPAGMIAIPRHRTITGMRTGAGLAGIWHHCRAYGFLGPRPLVARPGHRRAPQTPTLGRPGCPVCRLWAFVSLPGNPRARCRGEEISRRGPVDPATCVACESHPPDGVPVSRSVKNCGRYGAIAHQGRNGDRPIRTPLGGRGDPVLVHLTQRGGRATHPHTTTRSAHSSAASPPGFARVDPPTPPPRNPRHTPELGTSRRPDPQNPETRVPHHNSKIGEARLAVGCVAGFSLRVSPTRGAIPISLLSCGTSSGGRVRMGREGRSWRHRC